MPWIIACCRDFRKGGLAAGLLICLLPASCSAWRWSSTTIGPNTPVSHQQLGQLKKSCEEGDPESCNTAGIVLATGNHGVSKDENEARRLFSKACGEGVKNACHNLRLLTDAEPTVVPAL